MRRAEKDFKQDEQSSHSSNSSNIRKFGGLASTSHDSFYLQFKDKKTTPTSLKDTALRAKVFGKSSMPRSAFTSKPQVKQHKGNTNLQSSKITTQYEPLYIMPEHNCDFDDGRYSQVMFDPLMDQDILKKVSNEVKAEVEKVAQARVDYSVRGIKVLIKNKKWQSLNIAPLVHAVYTDGRCEESINGNLMAAMFGITAPITLQRMFYHMSILAIPIAQIYQDDSVWPEDRSGYFGQAICENQTIGRDGSTNVKISTHKYFDQSRVAQQSMMQFNTVIQNLDVEASYNAKLHTFTDSDSKSVDNNTLHGQTLTVAISPMFEAAINTFQTSSEYTDKKDVTDNFVMDVIKTFLKTINDMLCEEEETEIYLDVLRDVLACTSVTKIDSVRMNHLLKALGDFDDEEVQIFIKITHWASQFPGENMDLNKLQVEYEPPKEDENQSSSSSVVVSKLSFPNELLLKYKK